MSRRPVRQLDRSSRRPGEMPACPWSYEVVHSLPGRVRLRLLPADSVHGAEFARRLASHRDVRGTRWVAPARSLTVTFDPERSFADIVRLLPQEQPSVSLQAETRSPSLGRQFLVPLVSLVAGLSGLGLPARVAIALCGAPIARRALRGLIARRLTIDVLDATAVSILLAIGDSLAAGVSVALIETGERIRQRASGRARRVLVGWMGANPRGIRVFRPGSEPRLPVDQVSIGEMVVVYAGETIPVDGTVLEGGGLLDTRTWTGEPLPRSIAPASPALAGTTLVDGRIVIQVEATGEETRAGRLATALEDAIAANTRVYDRARRIADRFVVPAFLTSGLAWLLTRDMARVISILIVDFGTGIRISLPTTVLTTMIAGAREGILFKQGQSIDDLARIDTVVFDKTGTLTTGNPTLAEVLPEPPFRPDEVLRLSASAEGHLPHPLARAIRRAARRNGLALSSPGSIRYMPGGVQAQIAGKEVLVGDRRLLETCGISPPRDGSPDSAVLFVAVDGVRAARITVRDAIKESAHRAVAGLRALGIQELVLATGDRARAARTVGRQLGLDRSIGELMPEDKVALVQELRSQGRSVAVVGDGINDASAMAAADIGIAVRQGAEMAREAADVVLLGEDLGDLVTAIRLARQANRIVGENVGLAAGPNTLGLSLALAGRLPPLAATLLNNGSTLLATANGLRPLRSSP